MAKLTDFSFPSADERFVGMLATEEYRREHEKRYDAEILCKLTRLIAHYGIEPSPMQFYELSIALARELYPVRKKRGRRKKWGALQSGVLVVEVERLVRTGDPAHGVEWACRTLAKKEPWTSFLEAKGASDFGPKPEEALRQTYFAFREDRWASVSRHAFRNHQTTGTLPEWEQFVAECVVAIPQQ